MYVDQSRLDVIKETLQIPEFDSLTIDNFTFSRKSKVTLIKINNETIFNVHDITDITLELLEISQEYYDVPSNIDDAVSEWDTKWQVVEDAGDFKKQFSTPYEDVYITVRPEEGYTSWTIDYPLKTDSMFPSTFPTFKSAIASVSYFLSQYQATEIEYTCLIQNTALEVFTESEVVPNSIAVEAVDNNIYTFKGLEKNKTWLLRDIETEKDLPAKWKSLAGTDSEPTKQKVILDYKSKVTVDNI